MTSRMSEYQVKTSEVVDILLQTQEHRRADEGVRELYGASGNLRCAWTNSRLYGEFEVDHIIPFARRKDSSLWNLVPASRRANNSKRDKLPTLALLDSAQERIVDDWQRVSEWEPERFAHDALRLTGSAGGSNWERVLYSALLEAVETTATLRGVERWAG